MTDATIDDGRSNERTALAWQRTALSLLAGCTVMARLTWTSLGLSALALVGVAALLSLWVFVESRGRYAHTAGTQLRKRPRGGRAPAALALSAVLLGGTELVALVVS
jgi:uncharacterized membrane protein YidH (DUF202 family)